jgi:hypothetical protein
VCKVSIPSCLLRQGRRRKVTSDPSSLDYHVVVLVQRKASGFSTTVDDSKLLPNFWS